MSTSTKTVRAINASIDFIGKTISITKEDQKRASVVGSPAYKEMCQMLQDYPDFKVGIKQRKSNPNKKTYKNLTYETMKGYLEITFSGEALNAKMKEYEFVRARSAATPSPFTFVRKWFIETHPDYLVITQPTEGGAA